MFPERSGNDEFPGIKDTRLYTVVMTKPGGDDVGGAAAPGYRQGIDTITTLSRGYVFHAEL